MSSDLKHPKRTWPQRARRIGLRLAVTALVLVFALEGFLRFALFGGGGLAERVGAPLRKAGMFAHPSEEAFWKLKSALLGDERLKLTGFHPELGWCGGQIDTATLAHLEFNPENPRRLILLYGDSFAQCMTRSRDCWEGILRRSDLSDRFVLLNYGVRGYGFDQAFLMFQKTIDLYQDRDPIVIASALVDDDLKRSMMSMRSFPKPRFTLEPDGSLAQAGPPLMESVDVYLETNGIGIRSYLLAFLIHGTSLLPSGMKDRHLGLRDFEEAQRELNGAILREWHGELEARGLDSFFLVFHSSRNMVQREPWEHKFMIGALEKLRWPYQSARGFLRRDAKRTERGVSDYYWLEGRRKDHYTPLGNEVVFRGIRRALRDF